MIDDIESQSINIQIIIINVITLYVKDNSLNQRPLSSLNSPENPEVLG